ncbi:MAG TPA: imidazolonepropionase [Gemmatimonadales bacterium]|nr:imidazolonepropionase [Gemmatimonadales bacterium]
MTCRGPARARRGAEARNVEVLAGAAVLLDGSRIAAVGPAADLAAAHPGALREEVRGMLFPGFVDAHTHGVFGAPRLDDHRRRALGETYQAIAAAGGGILESVRDVRGRSEADLYRLARARLDTLRAHGTTTVEVKSGYGLDLEAELKQLAVIARLKRDGSPDVVATFLGAHEVPPEHRRDPAGYIRFLCDDMIPRVGREHLALRCDVFCEPGVFTTDASRRILETARRAGLALTMHADELEGAGGAELAVALGAQSADHLAAVSPAGIRALGGAETVAVLLPATMTFLGKRTQAPARALWDAGAAVALATDFNPGSSPTLSLPLVMALGVSQLGMRHEEALIGVTVNAAAALGLAQDRGQIAPGMRADLVALDVSDWREAAYWLGANLVTAVWTGGSACRSPSAPISLA